MSEKSFFRYRFSSPALLLFVKLLLFHFDDPHDKSDENDENDDDDEFCSLRSLSVLGAERCRQS